jgi:hypothetical protein
MKRKENVYGVILDFNGDETLATSDGAILVGSVEDMRRVFGGLVTRFVPIGTKVTVPLKQIREHAPGMFVKLVDGEPDEKAKETWISL